MYSEGLDEFAYESDDSDYEHHGGHHNTHKLAFFFVGGLECHTRS
jgi:hypothetical protein